jgi:phosphate transport system substrate-binding protein
MNGVEPTYENIASFDYPGARPRFIYVKKAHLDAIRGLREFVAEWAKSWGPDGPLTAIGLVASPADVAARSQALASSFDTLSAADLK